MKSFDSLESFTRLKELSKDPVDLTNKNLFLHERIKKFKSEILGFKLLYGFEKVNDDVIHALIELAKETKALKKMKDMQEGKIVNYINNFPSENKQALHTAMRDFFEDKINTQESKTASFLAYEEIKKLKLFLEKNKHFENLVQVGIGGSILGTKNMCVALSFLSKNKVYFVSNVDPDDVFLTLKDLDLKKTLFVIVSKSGSTIETMANEKFIKQILKKNNLDYKKHIACITTKNSLMDNKNEYLEVFYMFDFVCGRFSATSMVGGIALSFFVGFENYFDLLKGASKMDKIALLEDTKKNLPLMSALLSVWNRNFLNCQTSALIPYSAGLSELILNMQQYEMESNGKKIDKEGKKIDFDSCPIIWGDIGSNAQHSFFQFMHQGTHVVRTEFIGFKTSQMEEDILVDDVFMQQILNANLFAQAIALALGKKDSNLNKNFEGNRQSSILLMKKLTPYNLGALLSYFEHKVAFEAFLWNINPFDQEGVQLGKTIAKKVMNIFAKKQEKCLLGKALVEEIKNI